MKRILVFAFLTVIFIASCKQDKTKRIDFISPEAGSTVKSGSDFLIDIQFGAEEIDSVVYLIDSVVIARKNDTSSVKAGTSELGMGSHGVTAKIYHKGSLNEISSNIVVLASKAPDLYSFEVVNTYPHDTTSFIEGLEYHDGVFYESDGGKSPETGYSSLRKVEPSTGKILKQLDIPQQFFAEGLTLVGDKIIQITYQEGVGFVYDKNSFKKLAEFNYQAGREGWGLAFDGKKILNTDGSNSIYFLDKDNFQKTGSIEVYDHNGPVDLLNELEYIDGKIYANIYTQDKIVIIDPKTGVVEGSIDLSQLYPREARNKTADVLNGIAYDAKGRRLFVTGKKWDKLFEIRLIKK